MLFTQFEHLHMCDIMYSAHKSKENVKVWPQHPTSYMFNNWKKLYQSSHFGHWLFISVKDVVSATLNYNKMFMERYRWNQVPVLRYVSGCDHIFSHVKTRWRTCGLNHKMWLSLPAPELWCHCVSQWNPPSRLSSSSSLPSLIMVCVRSPSSGVGRFWGSHSITDVTDLSFNSTLYKKRGFTLKIRL